LDAAGPTAAFEIAERFRPGTYELALLAPGGGEVESSSGLPPFRRLVTALSIHDPLGEHDALRTSVSKREARCGRIFIRDGDVWTSAGISAGIDLALALIEDDLGPEVARRTAQRLVLHQRRPGGQSQFSALVDLGGRTARFVQLVDSMRSHLAEAPDGRASR
jgi:hypothetical protein